MKLHIYITWLLLALPGILSAQSGKNKTNSILLKPGIELITQNSDTLYSSNQSISYIKIHRELLHKKYNIELVYDDSVLIPTSIFGQANEALAALNAGFFNVKEGGSVTFLESGNELVATRSYNYTDSTKSGTFNGALVLTPDDQVIIEPARIPLDYLQSPNEKAVLITGPLLIHNNQKTVLGNTSFVEKRHPRSAIGITPDHIILLAVDGRALQAAGMSLNELQDFLYQLGCNYAINLDGGGSTTLWLNTKTIAGIVNHPSDNALFDHRGERKVANAIIIREIY